MLSVKVRFTVATLSHLAQNIFDAKYPSYKIDRSVKNSCFSFYIHYYVIWMSNRYSISINFLI